MKKFDSIEGLRGWLAWTVVVSHLAMTSDINAKGLGPAAVEAGDCAVLVFIIVSGFVITHLLIQRPEPYGAYLFRRFMRLFPLFVVTCTVGFFSSDIYAAVVSRVPWASDASFSRVANHFMGISRSDHDFFWAHVLAHLAMLHGAISERILPFSSAAFNAPAWSLSLEWQFYLVAPFAVALARQPRTFVWFAVMIAALEVAYRFGLFGSFSNLSFLPGAAGYFALGMASRLAYPAIAGTIRTPFVVFALFLVLIPLGSGAVPLLVWTLVFTGMLLERDDKRPFSFTRFYHYALESDVATYFGSRSYSIYLCHWPIIGLLHAAWLNMLPHASRVSTFFGLSAMVVPVTILVSELTYRGIERPGMALGSRLLSHLERKSQRRPSEMIQASLGPTVQRLERT